MKFKALDVRNNPREFTGYDNLKAVARAQNRLKRSGYHGFSPPYPENDDPAPAPVNQSPEKSNIVFVFVNEGLVNDVTDSEGNTLEHHIIDHDLRENGECPVCWTPITDTRLRDWLTDPCPNCGYIAASEDNDAARQAYLNLGEKQKEGG